MIDPNEARDTIVKQLEELGITSNEHDTPNELQRKLDAARAMNVDDKPPGQGWF
ncbi:hypothetical protein [Oceanobacillus kapialis]|uniref:Uncharacterized protein n=1 Tax=Oceanobacillus kapialis TaxID=481353 RepID=A0ABW5PZP1_9BACI